MAVKKGLKKEMEFSQGDRVKHPARPEWGIGKILDNSGGNLRIFFVGAGEKTLKTGYVNLIKLDESEAIHPVLDNLKTVKKDRGVKYRSLPLLIDNFLKVFPDGFYGDEYHHRERDYKMEAHKLLHETLNENVFSSLMKAGDYPEIHRRALKIVGKTNLIFPNEIMSLGDGLKITENDKLFAGSLFKLLFCKDEFESRFNDFSACLIELHAAKWTVATYFPFIAFPEMHMFLKPTVTQAAAEICGFELHYRSELNWRTYEKLSEFSGYLFGVLSELKPRDMIDVQSFIWCAAKIEDGTY